MVGIVAQSALSEHVAQSVRAIRALVRRCLGRSRRGYDSVMLTILLIILLVLLLTGGIGYSRRGRRL
jgi:hypothetical protein